MKKMLFLLIVLILAGTAQAEVELKDGSKLMKYFSEVERTQYFSEQLDLVAKLDEDGIIRATDGSNTTVTIQIHGAPIDESGSTAKASEYVGYITCEVAQHYPHATFYNSLRVVKAKSSGGCDYTHIGGPQPPTITWNLLQILTGPHDEGKTHTRSGLNPRWNDSSAFIVTSCTNGMWIHGDYMFVTLPPGFYFDQGYSTIYWLMDSVGQSVTC